MYFVRNDEEIHLSFKNSEKQWTQALKSLKNWWTNIISKGGHFGYYVNEKKSWLLKNEALLETAANLFSDSKVNITAEGKMHLGAALGSSDFRIKYVFKYEELKTSSNFVKSQPQAAYPAFCFEEQNKYSYFFPTIPSMSELMKPVDEIIQNDLLPSIIGGPITENERQLYSLPARSGGLGIPVFLKKPYSKEKTIVSSRVSSFPA